MSAERTRMATASINLAHAGSTRPKRTVCHMPVSGFGLNMCSMSAVAIQAWLKLKSLKARATPRSTTPIILMRTQKTGMVTMSDIDPVLELTDLMLASRAYGANSNAAKGLLRMHEQALRIGEEAKYGYAT